MTSTIHADKIMNSSGDQDSGVDLLVNDQVKLKTANTDRVTVTDATTTVSNNLAANTIKHTGGTTAMTIDSTGRILTPARPSFHVATSSTQDAATVVNWNTEIFDIGSNFNTSSNLFVAPIAGVYCFNCTALQAGNGAQMTISIRKNAHNNGRFIARTDGDSGEHHGCSVTALFNLAVNDTVEVYLHAGRIYGDTQFTNFTGFLLG